LSSLVNKMAKGSFIIFISKIVEAVVALAFSIILARLLGTDTYGLIGSTIGIAAIIGIFAKLGIVEASAKFTSEHLAKKEEHKIKNVIYSTVIIETVLGIITAIICFILAEPLAVYVFHKPILTLPLRIIASMIFFIAIANIFTGIFQGFYRMELFAIANISGNIIRLVSSVILVILGYGLLGAIFGFVLGSIVNSVLGIILYATIIYPSISKSRLKPKLKPKPIKPTINKLIAFGVPITITGGMMVIYQWTDTLCLTAFTLENEVEYISWYNIAFGMVMMTMIFAQTLNTAYYPIVSELNAKKKNKTIKKSYKLLVKILAHMMNILIISMIALSPQIILLLYGPEYLPAIVPFLILGLWGLIRPYNTFSGAVPIGVGKPKINAKVAVMTAAANLGLNLTLIPLFRFMFGPGFIMVGAALATTTSYLVGTFVMVSMTLKIIEADFPWQGVLKSLFAAIPAGLCMFFIMNVLISFNIIQGNFGLLINLLISFFIGLIIYLLILYSVKSFERSDITLLKELNIPLKNQLINMMNKLTR